MDNTLQNRIAVITGAGGGIGRAIAGKLAQQQMFTVLLGGNNLEKLAETRQLVERYSRCMVIPGDLTQVEFLQSAVAEIAGKCGGIDVLINNAGVAQNTPFEAITPAEFDRIMAINNRSPFFLTQAALPWLRQSPAATVINIASVVAHAGYPQQVPIPLPSTPCSAGPKVWRGSVTGTISAFMRSVRAEFTPIW